MNLVPLVGLALGWSLLEVVAYFWLEGVALALATSVRLLARGGWPGAVWSPFYLAGALLALVFEALLLVLAFFVMRFQSEGLFAMVDEARALWPGMAWGAGAVLAWHAAAAAVWIARTPSAPAWRIALAPTLHLLALGVFSVVAVYVMRDVGIGALAVGVLVALKLALDVGWVLLEERRWPTRDASPS